MIVDSVPLCRFILFSNLFFQVPIFSIILFLLMCSRCGRKPLRQPLLCHKLSSAASQKAMSTSSAWLPWTKPANQNPAKRPRTLLLSLASVSETIRQIKLRYYGVFLNQNKLQINFSFHTYWMFQIVSRSAFKDRSKRKINQIKLF